MQKLFFSTVTILSISLGLTGCFEPIPEEDDATPYIVNFTFVQPTSTSVSKNQYLPIEIKFDRNPSGYVHNVKVEIMDDKNVLVEKVFEQNVHIFKSYTYKQTAAFRPLSTGSFKIRASTTDENGKQENSSERTIMVQ